MIRFAFLLSVLALTACSSKPKTEVPTSAGPALFGFEGNCSHGVLSPKGTRAAALCQPKGETAAAQIFEFDFTKKSSRRATWQDGRISSVDWVSEDHFAYDSNTDEIKEAPFAGPSATELGAEIYMSDRFGTRIERWTERPGEDGNISSARDGRLLFVSRRGSSLVVFIRDQEGAFRPLSPLTPSKKFSPALIGRQAAWLEEDENATTVSLKLQGHAAPERWLHKKLRSLRAVANGWLLTEAQEDEKNSAVWFVRRDFACERLVWLGQEKAVFADGSSAASSLLLTLETEGQGRLVLKELPADSFSCSEDSEAPKMGT